MLLKIIILVSISIVSQSTTSLTLNNCPSDFNVNKYNTSLEITNQQLTSSIFGSVLNDQIKNRITNAIADGQFATIINEFTTVLGCFLLVFLSTVCCCLFERRCPPCRSWRRNYIKQPYTNCQRRVMLVIGVLFVSGILISTIIIFSTLTSLKKDVKMISCSMYYAVDVASNGEQTMNWGGFGQVQAQLSEISGEISTTATRVNSSLTGNQWIVTGFQNLENMNKELWERNRYSVVFSPHPDDTYNAMSNGSALPTITPRFIAQGLGPQTVASTMTYDIDQGFQTTKILSTQAKNTYNSAMTFFSSSSQIISNTDTNLQGITQVTSKLQSIRLSLDYLKKNYLSYVDSYGVYVMEVVFGLVLLGSLVALLGMVSAHIFQLFTCRKMVHLGWGLFGLMYGGVMIVMVGFMVVGGVSYSFCDYFNTVVKTQNSFISYSMKSDANALNHLFQYLDVCFFGDGNILKKFSVQSQMSTVSSLFTNTQTFLDMQTSTNPQYINIALSTNKILGWMTAMNNYGSGIYIDAIPDTAQTNPYTSLSNLNLLTLQYNSTITENVCANDLWVFDKTNCSKSASQSQYLPSADTTNGLYFPPTGSLCISLNTRISNSAPSIWTASDIAQRYLNRRGCNNTVSGNSSLAYDRIRKYAYSLTNYRDSRINLYQSLYDQLNSLLAANTQYNANMTTFTSTMNTFFSSVATLNNLVTNQINGLTISANCKIIADSFRFFLNMYCVNFVARSLKIGTYIVSIVICCLIILILMIGAVIIGGIFGVRFQRIQKQIRLNRIQQMQSETFREDISNVTEELDQDDSQDQHK